MLKTICLTAALLLPGCGPDMQAATAYERSLIRKPPSLFVNPMPQPMPARSMAQLPALD